MPLPTPPDPLDLATIYREYYKRIYNYIYGQILHCEVAEDLTADVFVAVAAHIEQFESSRGNFATWLFTIARNITRNYRLRSSTRLEEYRGELPECAADTPKGWDESLRSPENIRTERILAHLSQEERRFLGLRYVLDLSNEEIGRVIGRSQPTVPPPADEVPEIGRKRDRKIVNGIGKHYVFSQAFLMKKA